MGASDWSRLLRICLVGVLRACGLWSWGCVSSLVLCGGLWRSGRNRHVFLLLPTAFEAMSEALVGAVDGGCGISFAPSGDSACAVDPEFQPSWVLHGLSRKSSCGMAQLETSRPWKICDQPVFVWAWRSARNRGSAPPWRFRKPGVRPWTSL
jgi:hypothetical protein